MSQTDSNTNYEKKRLTKKDLKRIREGVRSMHSRQRVEPGDEIIFRGVNEHCHNYEARGWLTNTGRYFHDEPAPGVKFSEGEFTEIGAGIANLFSDAENTPDFDIINFNDMTAGEIRDVAVESVELFDGSEHPRLVDDDRLEELHDDLSDGEVTDEQAQQVEIVEAEMERRWEFDVGTAEE